MTKRQRSATAKHIDTDDALSLPSVGGGGEGRGMKDRGDNSCF